MKNFELDGIIISVQRKRIKNMHMYVKPPDGSVLITAPEWLSAAAIQGFAASRLEWLKKQREAVVARPAPQDKPVIEDGGELLLLGSAYRVSIKQGGRNGVKACGDELRIALKDTGDAGAAQRLAERWLRDELLKAAQPLADGVAERMGTYYEQLRVRDMKTRWGTCNIRARRIWLNLKLASRDMECLEYIITHELCHLFVRGHNKDFYALLERYYPDWKRVRKKLNG